MTSRRARTVVAALVTVAALTAGGVLPSVGLLSRPAVSSPGSTIPSVADEGGGDDSGGPAFRAGARFDPGDPRVRVRPDRYAVFVVRPEAVFAALADAPLAGAAGAVATGTGARPTSGVVFAVPTPAGGTERFAVRRTEVMQPGLAAAHPEIGTWAGRSLDHPGTTVSLDLTPMGFHAAVLGGAGSGAAWYVDPAYDRRGTTTELAYTADSVPRTGRPLAERAGRALHASTAALGGVARTSARPDGPVTQRVYRLALTSDPTYAAYFGTANVLAEKVTLVNRVDQIYNDDLAIWLQLVDGEDALNLDTAAKATGADGPCGAHACFDTGGPGAAHAVGQLDSCGAGTLGRNRTVLGQLIGAGGYDVGHIVLGVDGGGLSDVGTVGADYKAGGCTGISTPQGDLLAVDYLAHELGHEFGGTHDFDGYEASCGGSQHAQQASVEPGSGSSVMAYAGICGSDDLQAHSDPSFGQLSQRQLGDYVRDPQPEVNEVQTVSLRGFDQTGDQVTLGYPGAATSQTLTLGSTYSAAGIRAAVQALTGHSVVVGQWGYDPLDHVTPALNPPREPDDTGFQVIFSDSYNPARPTGLGDLAELTVTSTSPGVSGFVGETAQGGPARSAGDRMVSADHAPVVQAPRTRMMPIRTPFRLVAHGRDRDGDHLSYSWEQNDRGTHRGTRLLDAAKVYGPLFRIFGTPSRVGRTGTLTTPSAGENVVSGADRIRFLPDLAQVLAGNTDARSGTCPDGRASGPPARPGRPTGRHLHARRVACFSEFLPTADYRGDYRARTPRMRFVVTARDGSPGGGGVDQARVTLLLDSDAGPFLVTSQHARGLRYAGGSLLPVTWAVNGTRPLARSVSVLLSTDAGRSWRVVQGRTANDGRTSVRLPRVRTGQARVMVRARDNYFFAVNDRAFRIGR